MGRLGTDSLSVSVLQNSLNPLMLLGAEECGFAAIPLTSYRSAWPISPSVVDVVLRDPPRQQQPQQDYGWPGETVSGPAARGSFTDAKKSCCGDLGETKTGEGIAVVRRGHIAVLRRGHQVFRRGCVIAAHHSNCWKPHSSASKTARNLAVTAP